MSVIRLTRLHVNRLLKNKNILLLTLLMPVVVMCIVTFFTNGRSDKTNSIPIDFVNYDKGQSGDLLIKGFSSNSNFSVSTLKEAEATERVQHNSVVAAVIIPENFSENLKKNSSPSVKILKLNSGNSNLIIESKINAFISNNIISNNITKTINVDSMSHDENRNKINSDLIKEINSEKIQVNSKQVSVGNDESVGQKVSVNLFISFMMFSVIYIALEITERKNDGTLRRILSSPNSNLAIAGSFVLTFLIIGWFQVGLMIGATILFFKVSWGSSFIALFLLCTVITLIILGLGLLLCRFAKSPSSVAPIANLTTQVMCLLGGSYVPAEFFPDFLKKVSYFFPQSWAVDALTSITLKNKGVIDILPDLAILLLFAVAFFTAGVSSIKGIAKGAN